MGGSLGEDRGCGKNRIQEMPSFGALMTRQAERPGRWPETIMQVSLLSIVREECCVSQPSL